VGGGFVVGLSPYFFATALVASRVIPQWVTGRMRFSPGEQTASLVRVLAAFVLWCVVSAFVLPILFDGLPVDSARAGVDQGYYLQSALHWSPSNAGQAGYIILDFLLVLCLLQLSPQPGRLQRLVNAFSWSGVLVVAVGAYQIACHRLGLPFPSWLFNSNEAWSEAPEQLIGMGFWRMSATFVEPSSAGAFLSAWSVFELSLAISGADRTGWHWLCAAIGSIMLVETTSTTGYVTAAIMWAVMVWDCGKAILRHGLIKVRPTLAAFSLAGGSLGALIIMPQTQSLLDSVLFNKGTSMSALHRTATFGRAVEVFQWSWGLGVGLGSNRAMSVFFYILSNVGIPGTALFFWLLLQLYIQVRAQLRTPCCDHAGQVFLRALGGAFIANILALLVSGAEVTQPHLWILMGMLLATIRYNWLMEVYSRGQDRVGTAALPLAAS